MGEGITPSPIYKRSLLADAGRVFESKNALGSNPRSPEPAVDQKRAEFNRFSRPQVDNIVVFLKTLSDGTFGR